MYKDRYHNHFSGKRTKLPPQFCNDKNYLMRFRSRLSEYCYEENNLTIIYFKKGAGELNWKEKKVPLGDDKFIVTNPGEGWEYYNREQKYIDVMSFVVCSDFIDQFNFYAKSSTDLLLDKPFGKCNEESTYFLESPLSAKYYTSGRLLQKLHTISNTEAYRFLSAEELTIEVLQSLCKDQFRAHTLVKKIGSTKKSTRLEAFKRLLLAYEYIHDNIERTVTLDELSRQTSLSKFHLYNSFKNVYGKTPHQYINGVKLNKAKQYLLQTDLSITEVSDILGFSDIASFSKLFKKMYGRPPSVLKRKHAS